MLKWWSVIVKVFGADRVREALKNPDTVIPAEAGIQKSQSLAGFPLSRE